MPSWLSCSVVQLLLRLLWGQDLCCSWKLHADWRLGGSCLTRRCSRAMMLVVVGLLLLLLLLMMMLLLGMQDSSMHCQHHLFDGCELLL